MPDQFDLKITIESKVPIIVIESYEELRVLDILRQLTISIGRPMFSWAVTEGLKRIDIDLGNTQKITAEPIEALAQIKHSNTPGVYVLCDFHPFLQDNPKIVRMVKEIAMHYDTLGHTLIMLSHALEIPAEFKKLTAQFELSLPTDEQLLTIVREEALNWSRETGRRVSTDNKTLTHLVKNLRGLTFSDARRLARGAICDDGAIKEDDIPEVNKAKFNLMDMQGILSFEYDTANFAAVGGLTRLKEWLKHRYDSFHNKDSKQLDPPKGILLLGVQGGGKSLAAKAVAGSWQLPLLRLDIGSLYNKFHGETEKNLREALKLADMMAPCVLWMDEIEKGMASSGSDDGVSKRVLGAMLTWMAERKSQVFLVATSNDISKLPPELVRKGRFDEIFFVDLPDAKVREVIFKIHLTKREQQAEDFDMSQLIMVSEGFSGAEIEQSIVSALYTAAARKEQLSTPLLINEIANTNPLSVTMAENIMALRQWANERAVPAN